MQQGGGSGQSAAQNPYQDGVSRDDCGRTSTACRLIRVHLRLREIVMLERSFRRARHTGSAPCLEQADRRERPRDGQKDAIIPGRTSRHGDHQRRHAGDDTEAREAPPLPAARGRYVGRARCPRGDQVGNLMC